MSSQSAKAEVLYHTDEKGKKLEPMELAYVDVPDEFTGAVIDCFCDFGRKLVNLSLPVPIQCFAAMDGSQSLNTPWTGRLRRTRHSIVIERRQT